MLKGPVSFKVDNRDKFINEFEERKSEQNSDKGAKKGKKRSTSDIDEEDEDDSFSKESFKNSPEISSRRELGSRRDEIGKNESRTNSKAPQR